MIDVVFPALDAVKFNTPINPEHANLVQSMLINLELTNPGLVKELLRLTNKHMTSIKNGETLSEQTIVTIYIYNLNIILIESNCNVFLYLCHVILNIIGPSYS